MPVDFYKPNADAGGLESASIQPISNTEPVDASVTNRPTDNLRVRTEVLKSAVERQELLTAAPVLVVAEHINGTKANVGWDGPFQPGIASAVPASGSRNSGIVWIGTEGGGEYQLRLYLANSPPAVSVPASAAVTGFSRSGGIVTLTSAGVPAGAGSNALRVRVRATIPDASSSRVLASWSRLNSYTALPGENTPRYDTLDVQVRTDGTSTVSDLATAAAAAGGVSVECTDGAVALLAVTQSTPEYTRFSGGLDRVVWTLSSNTLLAFFNQGAFSTQTQATIQANSTAQSVRLASVTNIAPGTILHVGSAGIDYEEVEVISVDVYSSTVRAVFESTHGYNFSTGQGVPVLVAPNRLRAGDTLLVTVGDGKDRLVSRQLTINDLFIPRNGGLDQTDPVIVVASCPENATRLLFQSSTIEGGGQLFGSSTDAVTIGGMLYGDAAAAQVVSAKTDSLGVVYLNSPAPAIAGTPKVSVVDSDGQVVGKGLTSPPESVGPLSIGTKASDTGVTLGRTGTTVSIPSNVSLPSTAAATYNGPATFKGTTSFDSAPVFNTDVTFPTRANHTGEATFKADLALTLSTEQKIKKAVGDLKIGTDTGNVSGSVLLMSNGTSRWKLDSAGNLAPAIASPTWTITGLPTPTVASLPSVVANKDYVDTKVAVEASARNVADNSLNSTLTAYNTVGHTWGGVQNFSLPPQVPLPVTGGDAVNQTYLKTHPFGSVLAAGCVTINGVNVAQLGHGFGVTVSQANWTPASAARTGGNVTVYVGGFVRLTLPASVTSDPILVVQEFTDPLGYAPGLGYADFTIDDGSDQNAVIGPVLVTRVTSTTWDVYTTVIHTSHHDGNNLGVQTLLRPFMFTFFKVTPP